MTPELKNLLQQFDALCERISHVLRVNKSPRTKKARTNLPVSRHTDKKRKSA